MPALNGGPTRPTPVVRCGAPSRGTTSPRSTARPPKSRIADPTDPTRIFSWLICESYDDKGNAVVYTYVPEDSAGVDGSHVHERNRTEQSRSANRYLKRIKYGNRMPRQPEEDLSQRTDWLFEVVFDYDEGHYQTLLPDAGGRPLVEAVKDKSQDWPVRQDPFSSYRAGFEVRTYRLCRRVLMFAHFPDELGVDDCLVRSTAFTYAERSIATVMTSVSQSGYVRRDDGTYLKKSLPPLQFEYSQAVLQAEVREVNSESLENLPYGLDGARYQWWTWTGKGFPVS